MLSVIGRIDLCPGERLRANRLSREATPIHTAKLLVPCPFLRVATLMVGICFVFNFCSNNRSWGVLIELLQVFVMCCTGAIGVREDGVVEPSSGVDVMEEEDGDDDDDDDDDNDDDEHDDEEDEGGSDMDEDGADIIGDDSLRMYDEDDIYLPFDEGSGQWLVELKARNRKFKQDAYIACSLM